MSEYKFQIHDDFVAENVGVELKEQCVVGEVLFNENENTLTVEVKHENITDVFQFVSDYGFIIE